MRTEDSHSLSGRNCLNMPANSMEWSSGIRWLFLFISLELLSLIMCRCPMWTASPRRRPLTLLTMTPPRVENWDWHHFHYEKFSLVKLVEISRPNQSACSRSHSKRMILFWVVVLWIETNCFGHATYLVNILGVFWTLSIVEPVFVQ